MWGWRSGRTVVIGTAMGAFAIFAAAPVMYMLAVALDTSLREASTWRNLLLDSRQRALLFNTTALGVGTAVSATLAGVPLGIALARMALPFKPGLRILLAAPALVPSYVVGLAMLSLGESHWAHSLPAAAAVLTTVLYPISMLITEAAVRGVVPRLEEAASLVAAPARVLTRITLPLVTPNILAAALIVFVLAVSDFGVPALLRVRVFTTEIFTAFAALYDYGRATMLAMPLLLLTLGVGVVSVKVTGGRLVATRRGPAGGGDALTLDRWRAPATAAIACFVMIGVVLPLAILISEAQHVRSWPSALAGSGDAIRTSVMLAAAGATTVCTVALWLGYARARARAAIGVAADVLCIVLFAAPATIVGVALIGIWNRAGAAGAIYGTSGMLLLAYLARFTPLAALLLAASVQRIPVSHEEAAAVSGASWWRTMTRVVLPQMKLGLLAVWVIVFILSFGELGASVLVAPPGESTLPIRIYTLIANAPPAQVAVLALLQVAVVFSALAAVAVTLRAGRLS